MSSSSLASRPPPFTLSLPPTIYVSGSSIRGELELDYKAALEDDIDKIYVQLLGTIQTKNRLGQGAAVEQFQVETNEFLRLQLKLWTSLRSTPPRDGEALKLPFQFQIPLDAPPSFGFESYMNNAHVRYWLNVTGVRTATFALNRSIKVPVVVVPPDPIGRSVRSQLKLDPQHEWGRLKVKNNIRKFPWSDYSQVQLELLVPHIATFPLFTDIPYTIIVTTFSAPTKRVDMAPPEKNLFPPVPREPSEIDFELRRIVEMQTPYKPSNPEEHVADIISKVHAQAPPVETEIGEYLWIPDNKRQGRGRWRREASFHSHINLRFTPTFLTEQIKIKYVLVLRVEFPGLGNVLRIELPINIGSGAEMSMPVEQHPLPFRMIDLPSSYWKPSMWDEEWPGDTGRRKMDSENLRWVMYS